MGVTVADIFLVLFSKSAEKDLKNIPRHCVNKLQLWTLEVTKKGVREVRKMPGFHDEPLRGKRKGQRSIRLNDNFRAIYVEKFDGRIEFIQIEEVGKHDNY